MLKIYAGETWRLNRTCTIWTNRDDRNQSHGQLTSYIEARLALRKLGIIHMLPILDRPNHDAAHAGNAHAGNARAGNTRCRIVTLTFIVS